MKAYNDNGRLGTAYTGPTDSDSINVDINSKNNNNLLVCFCRIQFIKIKNINEDLLHCKICNKYFHPLCVNLSSTSIYDNIKYRKTKDFNCPVCLHLYNIPNAYSYENILLLKNKLKYINFINGNSVNTSDKTIYNNNTNNLLDNLINYNEYNMKNLIQLHLSKATLLTLYDVNYIYYIHISYIYI